jgi:hypothetical protein
MPWRRMGWEEVKLHSFLTSALDGGEWSASRPDRDLPLGKGPPVPIVQEAGWAAETRRKILYLCRGSNPGRSVRSQTLYRLSYRGSRIPSRSANHPAAMFCHWLFKDVSTTRSIYRSMKIHWADTLSWEVWGWKWSCPILRCTNLSFARKVLRNVEKWLFEIFHTTTRPQTLSSIRTLKKRISLSSLGL